MASSNSIKIRELEEQKRKNDADILIAQQKLQLDENRLAEDIKNNLRSYRINLDKNTITRLANDQLNEREVGKLVETMRNNLAKEIETNRHNLKEEELKLAEQALKKMDILLQAGKPTGKDAKAIVTSYLLNQTLLQAFGGTSVPAEAYKWITDGITSSSEDEISSDINKYGDRSNGIVQYAGKDGKIKSGILAGKYYNKETGEVFDNYQDYKASKSNEIPTDFSSSKGPGGENEKSINQEKSAQTSGNGNQKSDKSTSRGPGENIQTDNKSGSNSEGSTVIYSPGTKSGPGWGLFS